MNNTTYANFKKELLEKGKEYIVDVKKTGDYIIIYPRQDVEFMNTDILGEIVEKLQPIVRLEFWAHFDKEVLETELGALIPVGYDHFNTTVYSSKYKIVSR